VADAYGSKATPLLQGPFCEQLQTCASQPASPARQAPIPLPRLLQPSNAHGSARPPHKSARAPEELSTIEHVLLERGSVHPSRSEPSLTRGSLPVTSHPTTAASPAREDSLPACLAIAPGWGSSPPAMRFSPPCDPQTFGWGTGSPPATRFSPRRETVPQTFMHVEPPSTAHKDAAYRSRAIASLTSEASPQLEPHLQRWAESAPWAQRPPNEARATREGAMAERRAAEKARANAISISRDAASTLAQAKVKMAAQ